MCGVWVSGGWACDIVVERAKTQQEPGMQLSLPLCLEDYLSQIDLVHHGESEVGLGTMQTHDMMTFNLPQGSALSVRSDRRVLTLQSIFKSMLTSLQDEYGACELKMFARDRVLSAADFVTQARVVEEQAGTRIILRSEEQTEPRWNLECPDEDGLKVVTKSGEYFMVFIDVYENQDPARLGTKSHLMSYLFSFN